MTFQPQPVAFRGKVYPSQQALASELGVNKTTVYRALERGTLDDIGCGRGKGQPCILDGVRYPSRKAASRALGVHPRVIKRRLARMTPAAPHRGPDAGNEQEADHG